MPFRHFFKKVTTSFPDEILRISEKTSPFSFFLSRVPFNNNNNNNNNSNNNNNTFHEVLRERHTTGDDACDGYAIPVV